MKWRQSMKKIKKFLLLLVLGTILLSTTSYKRVDAATVSEAMNWCESLLGKTVGSGQCVAFIQSYYEYLGKSRVSGHARDYATNALPSGWSRVKSGTPQPGDILVYVGAKYGHVAIYAGGTTSYHQNMSGQYVEKKTNWAYNKSWYSKTEGGTKSYWGYIRPMFSDDNCNCSESYAGNYTCTSNTTLNIRSGHSTSSSVRGSIPSGATVYVSKSDGNWAHVEYNGISGCASMKYLSKINSPVNKFVLSVNKSGQQPVFDWNAVEGAVKYHLKIWKGVIWDGDPYVAYWGETGTSKWAALPTGTYQAYVDAELEDGTLVMSNVVEFTVEDTGLDFGAYVHGSQVEFQWAGQNASSYNIKIWKDTMVWDGDPYVAYWGETGTSKWAALPTGTYQAYVDAELEDGTLVMSNVVEFTVEDTGLDFGAYVHGSQVEFQWAGQDASSYHIKIWKDTMVWDGDPYIAYWGETGSSKWAALPTGTYQAYVDAELEDGTLVMSNVVEFTVEDTGLDFGAYVHGSQVEFQWAGQDASSYHIKIWKDTMIWDGDPYIAYWGETGTSKWISLPNGTYRGYIDADFGNGSLLMSNVIEFRVNTDADPSNKPVLFLSQNNGRLAASVFNTDHVTEYGFVYGNQSDITLETPGRTRIAYSDLDSNGSYSFDATEMTGCTIRAYAVYTDEAGATQVIYSDSIN